MSRHEPGATALVSDSRDQAGAGEHNAQQPTAVEFNGRSGSIHRPKRTDSLNQSGSQQHQVRPLARISSASSIESNSLGRRRRAENQLEPQYVMNEGSRSESNLISAVGADRDSEEGSDTESLDGRRVRAKYTRGPGRRRDLTSWGTPVAEQNSSGDLPWRSHSSGVRSAPPNTTNFGPVGESSGSNLQPSDGDLSQEAISKRGFEARHQLSRNNSNGEETSDTVRSTSRPVPPRKNSDWEPSRNRGNSSSSHRGLVVPCTNNGQNNPPADQSSSSSPHSDLRTTTGRSSSYTSRARALSSSSGLYDDSSSAGRNVTLLPHTNQPPTRRIRTEFVLPRWQSDAEVTFCPICRTQFNFFVRKHHCRKCGRVVCNSCSPHRITIPYQFIVQPPTYSPSPTASTMPHPSPDPARAGSSQNFTSIGGGERVRLCNPCVPDPNVAPPQQTSSELLQHRSSQVSSHSRSSSLATPYYTQSPSPMGAHHSDRPSIDLGNYSRRPREPSIFLPSSSLNNPSSATATQNASLAASGSSGSRSRSSTNTSNYNGPQRYIRPQVPQHQSNPQSHNRSLVPREESLQSRPLPHPPRVAEEDECPVCHQELPSSSLPNSEALREAHINRCIESAFGGTSSPAASRQPSTPSVSVPIPPIANTPEARMAAREQAHAAVVLGNSQSSAPARRTRIFPFKATEKDCIDDAECTICLEEFEVGEDMGRLECFCRFHSRCIRQWFELHPGQCPVHQHDGGY